MCYEEKVSKKTIKLTGAEKPIDDMRRERFQKAWDDINKRDLLIGLFFNRDIPSQDIPDLISETAYQAFKYIHRLGCWSEFDRWVVGIAKNIAHKYHQAHKRRREKSEKALSLDITIADNLLFGDCMSNLSELERNIVILRAIEGYKWVEISKMIGKPRSSVARWYKNAITKLRSRFNQ